MYSSSAQQAKPAVPYSLVFSMQVTSCVIFSLFQALLTTEQDIKALIRPSSAQKPEVKDLLKRGVKILVADISSPVEELVPLLHGVDIFISAISGMALLEQMGIVTAAKRAGVKRFVPCGFATVCPAGGVMRLRDHVSLAIQYH